MKEMLSAHNRHDGKSCRICSIIAASKGKQRERKKKLAKPADIVNGEYKFGRNVAPILPANRYRFGLWNSS
jgi:hypothetical protein